MVLQFAWCLDRSTRGKIYSFSAETPRQLNYCYTTASAGAIIDNTEDLIHQPLVLSTPFWSVLLRSRDECVKQLLPVLLLLLIESPKEGRSRYSRDCTQPSLLHAKNVHFSTEDQNFTISTLLTKPDSVILSARVI